MASDIKNGGCMNFLETYINDISLKLKEIDLFIKINEENFQLEDVSEILDIGETEVKEIMISCGIKKIDKRNFFKIMEKGSSFICKVYKREIDCGSPYVYTREDISYIYNIDQKTINNICDKLNIRKITAFTIPLLFSNISTV